MLFELLRGEKKNQRAKLIFFWEPLSPWDPGIVFELSRKKRDERKWSFLKLFRNFSTSLFVFFLSNEIYSHNRISSEKNDRIKSSNDANMDRYFRTNTINRNKKKEISNLVADTGNRIVCNKYMPIIYELSCGYEFAIASYVCC